LAQVLIFPILGGKKALHKGNKEGGKIPNKPITVQSFIEPVVKGTREGIQTTSPNRKKDRAAVDIFF